MATIFTTSVIRGIDQIRQDRKRLSPWWWLYLPLLTLALLAAAHYYAPQWTMTWLRSEYGAIERAQFFLIAISSVLAFRMLTLPAVRHSQWLRIWVMCAAVGAFYVAGEEISWGQHIFGWSTPEVFGRVNDQNETNLHNISLWFNYVPHRILELGVAIGGIILPLAALRRPAIRQTRVAIVVPSLICLPCAVIVVTIRLAKVVQVHLLGGEFFLSASPGENEELFLYAFILLYLVDLRGRLT